eukprot:12855703-Heterocapsa_arctica.AAC.1
MEDVISKLHEVLTITSQKLKGITLARKYLSCTGSGQWLASNSRVVVVSGVSLTQRAGPTIQDLKELYSFIEYRHATVHLRHHHQPDGVERERRHHRGLWRLVVRECPWSE